MRKHAFLLLGLAGILMSGCAKDELLLPQQDLSSSPSLAFYGDTDPCGAPVSVNLIAGQFTDAGEVTVYNTGEFLYVKYSTVDGWVLGHTHLYVGACDAIPVNPAGAPQIGQFPLSTEHDPYLTEYTYVIPLGELDECSCIAAHAEVHLLDGNGNVLQSATGWGEGDKFPDNNSWAMYFQYCEQPCLPAVPVPCDEQLRTQTQGGWGAKPQGLNPGTFLHSKFSEVFPNGLVIGCGNTVTFTSAQAITDYLPTGGPAKVLMQSYTDPGGQLKNVFVGQLTALALNVGFDSYFPTFGASDIPLADMYIGSGDFEGWTVAEVLGLAHQVLGGCNQDYTPSQLTEVLDRINNNYDNGTVNQEFLQCGPGYDAPVLPAPTPVVAHP